MFGKLQFLSPGVVRLFRDTYVSAAFFRTGTENGCSERQAGRPAFRTGVFRKKNGQSGNCAYLPGDPGSSGKDGNSSLRLPGSFGQGRSSRIKRRRSGENS